MKKLKIKYILLSITLLALYSCSSINRDRTPAGMIASGTASCKNIINNFFNSNNILKKRFHKLSKFREDDNYREYFETVFASYDNKKISKNDIPYGFSESREAATQKLMKRNNNDYIPSFYQFYDESGEDTFGAVEFIRKAGASTGEEVEEAFKDINGWVDNYHDHPRKLYEKIRNGFEAKMQLEILKDKDIATGNFSHYRKEEITLPWIRENNAGEFTTVWEKKSFNSFSAYDLFITDKELDVNHIFTQNIFEEYQKNSDIFHEIVEQGYRQRRLDFARAAIDDIPASLRSKEQVALLARIDHILFERPDLIPRSDAIEFVQKAEHRAEWKALFSRKKSKRKSRERFKYKTVQGIFEKVQKSTPMATARNWVLGLGAISAVGTITASFMLPVTEDPTYNMFMAYVNNFFINTWYDVTGLSKGLVDCSNVERKWSVENACYSQFIFDHTSYYYYLSKHNPDYNYLTDPEFLEIRDNLTADFLARRDFFGRGEFFTENINYLKNEGYRAHVDIVVKSLITKQFKTVKNLDKKIDELFTATFSKKDSRKSEDLIKEIETMTDSEVSTTLREYIKNEDKVVQRMANYGTTPKQEDLNEFMQEIKLKHK
ncbi:hypothetical protein A9Q84_03040 [Halobacteriovorax marinus]|uniref:Lipoprotein n=1 Tax=Halobacteriovorax marinus TaxID=97084 RepID=A0A1Y5FIK1_9BACT|nr:hypothetical protein A9Q84_03040 [Halobacteriovorax marinus]